MAEAQEKLKLQSKELKDAIGQRKLAMTEYTEVSDKYVPIKKKSLANGARRPSGDIRGVEDDANAVSFL